MTTNRVEHKSEFKLGEFVHTRQFRKSGKQRTYSLRNIGECGSDENKGRNRVILAQRTMEREAEVGTIRVYAESTEWYPRNTTVNYQLLGDSNGMCIPDTVGVAVEHERAVEVCDSNERWKSMKSQRPRPPTSPV